MKLRTVHVPSPIGPEQTRDQVAYVLGTLGWTGRWIDPWSGMARQGSEGASVIAGPFAGFCEVHWAVEVAPTGEVRVTIAQVRNSWVGKGGIVDGRRAGARLDELLAALQTLWSAPGSSGRAATATPAATTHAARTSGGATAPSPGETGSPWAPAAAPATEAGATSGPSPWAGDAPL